MDIEQKLTHQAFLNRELSISHLAYERENAFFNSIQEGNVAEMQRLYAPLGTSNMGRLSDNPLRNLQYHLIITVALITRSCIEGGMEMEEAYNLSDIYIRAIDKCASEDEINMLHSELVLDNAQRMQIIRKRNRYPKAITVVVDYIYDNLHTKLTLAELANVAGLSVPYLSKLFRKEVGITVSEYITRKRIETAENMLRYSDFSCLAIADYLCFSSESHFIQVFRKYTGYTPKRYREAFFRIRR